MQLGWISLVEGVKYWKDSLKPGWHLAYAELKLSPEAINLAIL